MIAQLLVILLFIFLTFVGQAVVSLFRPRLGVLWSWFIAPTIGLAVLVLIMTRLNVWGIPVKSFGPWLTVGLGVFAAAVFAWRRPVFPWRQLLPFFAIAGFYLLYTGWPLLRFGFDWVSYGNDDMANYCLAADRFLNHGYYDLPAQTDLEGNDYAQHYWFMHGLQQIRPGSELAISWVASLTGKKPHEVFMPTILMLSMLQIFALGAVSIFKGRLRKVTMVAFALFATSPLFGLGTLYQLIAQVGGIAILLAAASLLFSSRHMTWRKLALAGIITGCLGIYYPEVAPFVALGILLFAARLRYTDMPKFKGYALFITGTAVLTFLLIGTNTYQFINTLVMQSVGSAGLGAMAEINDQSGGLVLFPWTLVPSFVPMLFGLHPFGVVGTDPFISIQIIIGFIFLGYTIWRAYRNILRNAPAGYLGANMIFLGFFLFFKGQDFGLFKLAMFAQPIITLFVAQAFCHFLFDKREIVRRRTRTVLVVFMLCTAPSHIYYSYASLGTYGGGLTEVVGASKHGVKFEIPKNLQFDGIESDISNVVTAKMLAQYTQGHDTRFLSRSYMDNIANIAVLKFLRTPDPDLGPQARIIEKLALLRFLLPQEIMTGDVPDYRVMNIQKLDNNWNETSSRHLNYRDRLFVAVRSELDHFNKANPGEDWTIQNMYQYKLESQLKDRLVFIHSELSPHYYSSARFKAAFFQREPEPISGGDIYFHGTGRYNLFHVINPSEKLRMVIDFSRTSLGEGRSQLPSGARIIGDDDYPIPFVGHGSARVFTNIIKPEYFEQQAYLTVDFGDTAKPIFKEKGGLMDLYGQKYNLDDRRLIGFTRDISIITDEQYRNLPRPTRISSFPSDLYNYPGLEYSGLFEDGWVNQDAYIRFGASHPGQVLIFRGYIPRMEKFIANGVNLTISINNKPTELVNLPVGDFEIPRLIREPADITSISLHFSDSDVYDPKEDKRPVSAFVRELVISDVADVSSLRRLSNEKGERFHIDGLDDDGWLASSASFACPFFSSFKILKIDLEMPGWASVPDNEVTIFSDDSVIEKRSIPKESYQSIYIPIAAGSTPKIRIESSQKFKLPEEERERSLLIKNISYENLSHTDLIQRGWHRSGYMFAISGADSDGWVDRSLELKFPATSDSKTAIVEIMPYPARSGVPVTISTEGAASETRQLQSDVTTRINIPLSSTAESKASINSELVFKLGAEDPRERSFRVVNIDFQ